MVGDGRPDAWIGLALAWRRQRHPGLSAIVSRPDLVQAVWQALDGSHDAADVAAWMSPETVADDDLDGW